MIPYNLLQGDCYEILKRLSCNPQENNSLVVDLKASKQCTARIDSSVTNEVGIPLGEDENLSFTTAEEPSANANTIFILSGYNTPIFEA
jgi:hypothetical protein